MDLPLFDSTQEGVTAEAIRARLEGRLVSPPTALLLRPEQAPGLTRRLLEYFVSEKNLPPVIVLVLAGVIEDGRGNTYALAFWA